MINHRNLAIKSNFNEQYTIDIETEMNGVTMSVISKVRLRYDFTVLKVIEDESIEIRLVQLENILLETDNDIVKEMAQVSQVFGRMYSELHLKISPKGKVLEVLNNDVILSKWQQTKAEMEKAMIGNDGIKEAITLNDSIFTNPDKIRAAVEANEFFRIYFGEVFAIDLPVGGKTIEGTNFFNTANMEWSMNVDSIPLSYKGIEYADVTMTAKPNSGLTSGFYNAAYNQFADKIDITKLNAELNQYEIRKIELKTGKVVEALITKTEIADPQNLFIKMKYILRSDSYSKLNKVATL